MPRKKSRTPVTEAWTRRRARTTVLVTLLLGLSAAGTALAGLNGLAPALTHPVTVALGEVEPAAAAQGNFAADRPAKEYIYVGGRLVATEEPAATSTPTPTPTATPTPTVTPTPTPTPPPSGLPVEDVVWTHVSPTLQPSGNSIQKLSGDYSWYDAGAVSTRSIAAGDGYVEFTPGDTGTFRMIGLGNGDTSYHLSDIEYALFVAGDGMLYVHESGEPKGVPVAYAAGDRLKVAVEGGVVKYYRNGTAFYTSEVTPSYPLLVDTSFNTVYARVINVQIAGNLTQ